MALYHSGRQAEALRALSDARTTLRDELGIEPGRDLRELESAILDHDRALDAPPPPAPAAVAPEPAASPAPVDPPTAATGARPVGRGAELAQLLTALDEARAGLSGTAGR